ncbi:hypothetical protein CQA38_07350 [Campylobacter sp. MIT 12-5580]|uniref:Cj0814 family flagellar-dependent secreted protein n=1 Tax=Campylobacter sp. MIT 12-5580 TaxID=2040651 RepID=UPI0010FA61EE|nr:hypothetical protein [Campylobacter sp. MIT 12-5580]TKX28484.1 hypothetical protein CQA38_07350 [Campylobacter sp. MIT 12-5580]
MLNSLHSYNSNPLAGVKANLTLNKTSSSDVKVEVSASKNTGVKEVLGYAVDKDGYFTEEFNEAAGIPKDIKIHSSTMESLNRSETTAPFRDFISVDPAKTIANAYKLLTQVIGEDAFNAKNSFTLDEIASFPQGIDFDRQSLEVLKVYESSKDYKFADMNRKPVYYWEYTTATTSLFYKSNQDRPATDIFGNNNGGQEGAGVFINANGDKYTNSDGSITKGGLLVGIVNHISEVREGETTIWGKIEGLDKNVSVKEAWAFHEQINLTNPISDSESFQILNNTSDFTELKNKYAQWEQKRTAQLAEEKKQREEMAKGMINPLEILFEQIKRINEELLEKALNKNKFKIEAWQKPNSNLDIKA